MRVLLISPTHYTAGGSLHKTTRYWTSGLTLPYLKALTPPGHEVSLVDELFYDVDLNCDTDLVGITAMGPQIKRAYDLADHFRGRGVRVVLGGTWVSLTVAESLKHADAVVAGEAEEVWPQLLADFCEGRNRRIYRSERWHSLVNLPRIDYTSLPLLKYEAFKTSWLYRMYFHWPVVFSRGCPHPCEYCAVQTYYQRGFRTRPVAEVIEDLRAIKALGASRILFLDDNPIGHPDKAKELFRAMLPLKLKWASQATINIARDPELLDLAARSGCVSLSIGLESISAESLESVNKGFNLPHRFAQDLAAIRRRGIQVIALLMVGLDGDKADSFSRSLDFLLDNKVSFLKLFTPCPYPGTKFYDEMSAAGRILVHDWGRYDYGSPLIRPAHMTPAQMMDGFKYVYEGFYSVRSIAKRLLPPPRGSYLETLAYLVANLKVNRYLHTHENAWATIS
ncbi:MAG: B12-binding domain-containing radical SAM protein [Deltaproteobacteria bacterium]|nr:B12-binding domain-containing radical SAM protein [Deltaproteobacteria bacterium]